jgi:hypothetical protein
MERNTRFIAKELPDNEMDTLYSLLGKENTHKQIKKRKSRLYKPNL